MIIYIEQYVNFKHIPSSFCFFKYNIKARSPPPNTDVMAKFFHDIGPAPHPGGFFFGNMGLAAYFLEILKGGRLQRIFKN